MSKLTIDKSLRVKLKKLREPVEICDEAGKTLGHFLPADLYFRLLYRNAQEPISEEELDRREKTPGGRTLKEIWKRLGQS